MALSEFIVRIIPVIDLKHGLVVHARQGQRKDYAPIHSSLCQSPVIEDVLTAYLKLYSFPIVYIADLDAITENKPQKALISPLLHNFPNITFWIDSGFQADPGTYAYKNHLPVLGSEAYSTSNVSALNNFDKNYILSLDFSATQLLGAEQIMQRPDFWPENIIIMTLHRVGSELGPDLTKLKQFKQTFPQHNFIAAGGIRGQEDLVALQEIGIETALVASALHSGAIGPIELRKS